MPCYAMRYYWYLMLYLSVNFFVTFRFFVRIRNQSFFICSILLFFYSSYFILIYYIFQFSMALKVMTQSPHTHSYFSCMILNSTIRLSLGSSNIQNQTQECHSTLGLHQHSKANKLWIQPMEKDSIQPAFETICQMDWSAIQQFWFMGSKQQKLGPFEMKCFARNQWPGLKSLKLMDNEIGDEGIQKILKKQLKKLQDLNISNNGITMKGLKQINNWNAHKLINLKINENKIGSNGIKLLAKAMLFELQILNISECHIGNEGARSIVKGNWPQLREIHLAYNFIVDGLLAYFPGINSNKVKTASLGKVEPAMMLMVGTSGWNSKTRIDIGVANIELRKDMRHIISKLQI